MIVFVTFKPLEPYTFGTDQSFSYQGTGKTGRESYLATSRRLPEQTTLLGTLRYLALVNKGLLRTDYDYSEDELGQMARVIGPESFRFGKQGQSFGEINALSPLFLYGETDQSVLVPNPFHNTAKDGGCRPMLLGEPILTSAGPIPLPADGQYDAKKGHADGFIDLRTGEIRRDLFRSVFITGNRKSEGAARKEGGFYRREVILLQKGFRFAVLADTAPDTLPEKAIAYMGLKRAAFQAEVSRILPETFPKSPRENTPSGLLREAAESGLGGGEGWYYALSDLCMSETWTPAFFCIVEKKSMRNMETVYRKKNEADRRRRSSVQINLAAAGSVFYREEPQTVQNSDLEKIGYNIICRLGGK